MPVRRGGSSAVGRRGFLIAAALAACGRARRAAVVALHEPGQSEVVPTALRGRIEARSLGDPRSSSAYVPTVVIAGHSEPPLYLGRASGELARAVAALGPELVVLDTCFGASLPLLVDLARALPGVYVVAAPFWVGAPGLVYDEAFFGDAPREARAGAVRSRGPRALFRARLDAGALAAAASVSKARGVLEAPGLLRVPAGEGGDILIVVEEG